MLSFKVSVGFGLEVFKIFSQEYSPDWIVKDGSIGRAELTSSQGHNKYKTIFR